MTTTTEKCGACDKPVTEGRHPGCYTTNRPRPRPRQCFIIQVGQCDDAGYIPSLVIEGEPGHQPLSGDPSKLQTPWHWGTTYEAARAECARQNAALGLSEADVIDIVCSSMGEGRLATFQPPSPSVDPMAVYTAMNEIGGFFDTDDVVYCSGDCGRSWPVGMTYDNAEVQAAVIEDLRDHRSRCHSASSREGLRG